MCAVRRRWVDTLLSGNHAPDSTAEATATTSEAEVEDAVREHAGPDAEIEVVAPASKISRLDRWTNAEDDARKDASARAEAVSNAISNGETDAHVGDVDPL